MPIFETPEPINVVVDIGVGTVRINASDRTDTAVDVQPTDAERDNDVEAAEQTAVDYADGRLTVTSPKGAFRLLAWRKPSIQVTIDVPTGSHVTAKTWATIRSTGRLGDCTFDTSAGHVKLAETGRLKAHTSAGDVSVSRITGHADLDTSAGNVWVGTLDGTGVVKVSAGELTVREVNGDVRLHSSHGGIVVDRALGTVGAKTAYGQVTVGEFVAGKAVLETSYGDVEVGVAERTAAWLDLSSERGAVHNQLDAAEGPGDAEQTVELRARTSWGDVVVHRA